MVSIEHIQYQAALIMTGAWKGSNRNKLYGELGWESLSDRRWSCSLNGLTPNYLIENQPSKRRLVYGNINPNIH